MFGTALETAAGFFSKRFVVSALIPTLAVSAAVLALVVGDQGWNDSLKWWRDRDSEEQALLVIGAITALVFVASLLTAQILAITKLYEGYWGGSPIGSALASTARSGQERKFKRLDMGKDEDFETRYRYFPRKAENLLPTRLGNVLRGAEEYPNDEGRYGMDAVFFWPRLYAVMPDSMRAALADARSSMEQMLITSLLGFLFTAFGAIFSSQGGASDAVWIAAVGGGLSIGWLAYRSAVRAASIYAELVRTSFDLYRGELIEQMGFERPASLAAERKFWSNLNSRLYRRGSSEPGVLKYATKEPAEGSAQKASDGEDEPEVVGANAAGTS